MNFLSFAIPGILAAIAFSFVPLKRNVTHKKTIELTLLRREIVMTTKSELRIAIIGGGIGGASAADALNARGIRADVYEQTATISEVGAGIGVRPPSVNSFKKWGL